MSLPQGDVNLILDFTFLMCIITQDAPYFPKTSEKTQNFLLSSADASTIQWTTELARVDWLVQDRCTCSSR